VRLGAEDVSAAIRTPEMSAAASAYSAVPEVRAGLLGLQRRVGAATDAVVDGRDIGTVVFPDAEVKIFLTASAEARAERRHLELEQRGEAVELATVLAEIRTRDHNDSTRAVAPLRQAEDAVLVDTTHLDLEGAVAACVAVVEGGGGG
jgi:cytidylate kinase